MISFWRRIRGLRPRDWVKWVLGGVALAILVTMTFHGNLYDFYENRFVDRDARIEELTSLLEEFYFVAEEGFEATYDTGEDIRIIKWQESIIVRAVGLTSPATRQKIADTSALLSQITGLQFLYQTSERIENQPLAWGFYISTEEYWRSEQDLAALMPNILIIFLNFATIEDDLAMVNVDVGFRQSIVDFIIDNRSRNILEVPCLVQPYVTNHFGEYSFYSAAIIIHDRMPQPLIDSCIVEELAQAMGPRNDISGTISVFNDDEIYHELTDLDRMVLGTYYEDELVPGMSREEARPILKDLISRHSLWHGFPQIWQ